MIRLRAASPLLLALLLVAPGCSGPEPGAQGSTAANSLRGAASRTQDRQAAGRIFAVLINGGGSPQRNFQSHLAHVREILDFLAGASVAAENIAVFASDGEDPAPDLAMRDRQPERRFWLIDSLPIGALLKTKVYYENSVIDAATVYPATHEALKRWFAQLDREMHAGDTLLVYVTDHGKKNSADTADNAIVLWGEDLFVRELAGLIASLPAQVRTVALMSQCYSGSFANLIYGGGAGRAPSGRVCGYFSTTATRGAYGCYPENEDKDAVGHSFRFLEALEASGSFVRAHERSLITDRTPDAPMRSSDLYAADLIAREAGRSGRSSATLIDEYLEQAWRDELHYAALFDQVDAIGAAFGSFGPRSLAELDSRADNLPDLSSDLSSYARDWQKALVALKQENFTRFLAAKPFWADYLGKDFVAPLTDDDKRELAGWLLEDLWAFTEADASTLQRLRALSRFAEEARSAAYRMEVRLGAVVRMRTLLTRIAGMVYIDRFASPAEQAAWEALADCEDLQVGRPRTRGRRDRKDPEPFPSLVDEMRLIGSLLPGWLGIEYNPVDATTARDLGLEAGAVRVSKVYPHSPAAGAGLRVGDLLLGPPGEHFVERNRIREWVTTSLAGETRLLDVIRGQELLTLSLRMEAAPGN